MHLEIEIFGEQKEAQWKGLSPVLPKAQNWVVCVDTVTNCPLTETSAMEEIYNDCMTSLKGKLEGQRPERSKPLLTGAAEFQ